jgi:large-conductance mechanosensitive channel
LNVIFPIISLIPFLLILFVIIFGIGVVRRMERRADERLKLEKENAALQQQQFQEIKDRLTNIEKILKEVD